jgi:hypothetical protein
MLAKDSERFTTPMLWELIFAASVTERRVQIALGRLDESLGLMRRCHGWFADNGLSSPTLYVPPAWALGDLGCRHLCGLPFRSAGTLLGLVDPQTGRFFSFRWWDLRRTQLHGRFF